MNQRRRPCALVTRPRDDAAPLVAALAERGVAALVEPLLTIEYRDGPAPDLAGVQAVLCTSANGVRALARLSAERHVPLFAVGEASAAEARRAGFAQVASAGGNAADLARLVRERLRPNDGRLLHIAGSEVAGDLAGELRHAGFAVDRAVTYDACAATTLSDATAMALQAGAIDYALFFSPRTAAIFARLARDAGAETALEQVTAISISPAANTAHGGLAFHDRLVAARPDQSSLLAEIDRLVEARCPA